MFVFTERLKCYWLSLSWLNQPFVPDDAPMRRFFGLAASTTLIVSGLSLMSLPPVSAKPVQCPDTWTGTKCDYYKDGFKAGKTGPQGRPEHGL